MAAPLPIESLLLCLALSLADFALAIVVLMQMQDDPSGLDAAMSGSVAGVLAFQLGKG